MHILPDSQDVNRYIHSTYLTQLHKSTRTSHYARGEEATSLASSVQTMGQLVVV